MTATMIPNRNTNPRAERREHEVTAAPRVLEIVVEHYGDAVHFARRVAAAVSPSPLALVSASVDDIVVYPAGPAGGTSGTEVCLRLRCRDRRAPLTSELVDDVVSRLGRHGVVLSVSARP